MPETLEFEEPIAVLQKEIEALTLLPRTDAREREIASLGRRIHELCSVLTTTYRGKGSNVWKGVASGDDLYRRLRAIPGYGTTKGTTKMSRR